MSATFLENMWNSRYLDLLDFHKQFGNCNVPISYKNQALVNWVIDQRHQHKCLLDGKPSTLSKARIDLLNSVGFNWKNNSPIGAMLNGGNNNLDHHRRMSLQNTMANKNSLQMMNHHRRMSLQNAVADSNENPLQQMMNNRRMSLQSVGTDVNENQLQQMMNNRRMSLQNAVININENQLQQMTNNRRVSLPNIPQSSISMANAAKLSNISMTSSNKDIQNTENDDAIDDSSTSSITSDN